MTDQGQSAAMPTWVAIDIAKDTHTVLLETVQGERRAFRLANRRADFDQFVAVLKQQPGEVRIALEPTGDYHRALAYRLVTEGFTVCLISSVASARYRDARFNSWDKNDPKDAAVLLALLKQGLTQRYVDPLVADIHELQELSKTYFHLVLARTRVQHSILHHYLPLYFPEIARYWHANRTEWFIRFLVRFPVPTAITALSPEAFLADASPVVGRKVNKAGLLRELYDLAHHSIALPITLDSLAVRTFRLQLERFLQLEKQRTALELESERLLQDHARYRQLRSIPGIGPVLALTILAEAGDRCRFPHHRQFLKYCGLDLAKSQSGAARGREMLSKRGNARLRCACWFAGTVAVRMRENTFRAKYERYIHTDPTNADRKRKAVTAVAAKMARVIYAVVKTNQPYRSYVELGLPSGSIPFRRAVDASSPPSAKVTSSIMLGPSTGISCCFKYGEDVSTPFDRSCVHYGQQGLRVRGSPLAAAGRPLSSQSHMIERWHPSLQSGAVPTPPLTPELVRCRLESRAAIHDVAAPRSNRLPHLRRETEVAARARRIHACRDGSHSAHETTTHRRMYRE